MIYQYDCGRQPDPEIWGGGSTTGNVSISGQALERVIYEYPAQEPYVTKTLYGSATNEQVIKQYVGDLPEISFTGICVERVIFNTPEETCVLTFSGAATDEQVIYSEDLVDFNVFTSGAGIEKVTYDYNIDSTEFYEILDYGSTGPEFPIDAYDDYGFILNPLEGTDDFGSTEILQTTNPFGTLTVNGSSLDSFISSEDIIATTIQIYSGCAENVTFEPPIDETYLNPMDSDSITYDDITLTFDSNEPKPNIKLVGSATIRSDSNPPEETPLITTTISSIERVGYDYNIDSVNLYDIELYGTIDFPADSFGDYGSLISPLTQGEESYGDIRFTETLNPFGTIVVNGSAFVVELPDIRTYNTGASYRVSYNPPENEASLFTFGERKVENIVYDYNESSIILLELEDYQDISSSPTSSEDYGLITSTFITETGDYGSIEITSSLYPFGLFGVSGSAGVEYINKNFYGYVTGAEVKVVYSPDDTSGSLFGFGDIEETVTYSYNESSAIIFETLDYGSVSGVATEFADDGFLSEPVAGISDYGTFDIVSTTYPFGLFSVSGSAETEHINKNFYGYVTGAEVKVVYSPDDTSGTLFSFGDITEKVTYDYNEDSIYVVGDTDFGQLINPVLSSSDYGFISIPHGPSDDYGDLIGSSTTEDIYPFGTITLSGEISSEIVSFNTPENTILTEISGVGDESITYTPPINPRLYQKELGSTELTFDSINQTFDSTEEVPDIKLTGSGGIVPATYSEVGGGSLFNFGELEESVTYDYNEDSILYLITEDYGDVSVGHSDSSDYGDLISPISQGIESYGLIEDVETDYPFGQLTLSGSAGVIFQNYDIYGSGIVRVTYSPDDTSGTLFGFGEKYESVTYDYSESSIFFFIVNDYGLVSVASTQSEDFGLVSEVYVGIDNYGLLDSGFGVPETIYPFGTISISGTTEPEILTYSEVGTSLFVVSGTSYTDYTPSPDGSGTLVVGGSADVAFSPDFVASDRTTLSGVVDESTTYNYNESSILYPYIDYGQLDDTLTGVINDYGFVNEGIAGKSEDYGLIISGVSTEYPYGTITISADLTHPDIDYTPSYTGSGTLTISGTALESETDDFGSGRRRGGNIRFNGCAIEKNTEDYVGIGTIVLDREGVASPALIARARSYVGIETIILSDNALESESESYVASGIISLSGSLIEKFTGDTPDGTQLFTIYGELNHPDIDYTPHYGIEKNIGIGTTGIQLIGTGLESESDSYIGLGTVVLDDGVAESFTRFVPIAGISTNTTGIPTGGIGGQITISNEFTRYYSPVYPRNALIGDPGSGIGTIRINDDKGLAFTRAVLPIFAKGKIYILGIGTAGNGDLDGVEIGAKESFTPATAVGTGLFNISGIASTRQIDVFTYVSPADGIIYLSTQTALSVEKNTESYVGFGQITLSETISFRETNSYSGSGTFKTNILTTLDSSDLTFDIDNRTFDEVPTSAYESFTVDLPETTLDVTISGSAESAFVAQPVEDSALYTFYGSVSDIQLTHSEVGSGTVTISGSAITPFQPKIPAFGGIRFVSITGDKDYPTCDSEEYTCDRYDDGVSSFTTNPPENTVELIVGGNGSTAKIDFYQYSTAGLFEFSGNATDLKTTKDYVGIGTLFTFGSVVEKGPISYTGFGTITLLSGSAESRVINPIEDSVLFNLNGSAETRVESEYEYVGVGNVSLYVFLSETAERKTSAESGSGIITISGEVIEPTGVKFIPVGIGFGRIRTSGISENSLTKNYDQTFGTLFTFSSGLESIGKPTYTGLGTIFYDSTISGITTNNPFQIARSYVCII